MEAKLDQLRRLVETADREKVELMNQLEEEKRFIHLKKPVKLNDIEKMFL